jgi:hypothetical protein
MTHARRYPAFPDRFWFGCGQFLGRLVVNVIGHGRAFRVVVSVRFWPSGAVRRERGPMAQSKFGALRARGSNMAFCANAAPMPPAALFFCANDAFFLRQNSMAQNRLSDRVAPMMRH